MTDAFNAAGSSTSFLRGLHSTYRLSVALERETIQHASSASFHSSMLTFSHRDANVQWNSRPDAQDIDKFVASFTNVTRLRLKLHDSDWVHDKYEDDPHRAFITMISFGLPT